MRILHTSDWHVGRTFHGTSTLSALGDVLDGLVDIVATEQVDVVAIAGDVFDSATPAREAYVLLGRVLRGIREAGAVVVLVSGNHDSGERLGYLADFTAAAGVHIATRIDSLGTPVILRDEHGPVFFYGIPFIEPVLARRWFPDAELRTQEDAIRLAVDGIRARHPAGERSVILAHTFVSPGAVSPGGGSDGPEAGDAPRDFTQGGVDVVPVDLFTQFTYAALGHIHGRSRLTPNVRYSGSPLAYSFTDAGKPRGAWLVDLDAIGLADVRWVDLPIPRSLAVLSGTLDDLLADPAHASAQECWMRAILTDQTRPMEAMNRLRSRFPYCVQIEYRPAVIHDDGHATYGTRVAARTDEEIIAAFLELVRNGEGPSEQERALVADLVAEQRAEASR